MANYCYYEMKVTGKKENIDRLINILQYKDDEYKLARIFSADVVDRKDTYAFICGDCAWSIHSCMGIGEGTYSKDNDEITNIKYLSKVLGLKIEILSDEPGMGFCEHYFYDNGNCLLDVCEDYPEFENDIYEFSGIGELVNFEYI